MQILIIIFVAKKFRDNLLSLSLPEKSDEKNNPDDGGRDGLPLRNGTGERAAAL